MLGLASEVDGSDLQVAVNTADDFEHFGLPISPDLDTVMYTLAGISHPEQGWGLANESWQAMEMLRAYGAEDWFNLGDKDLATHLMRKQILDRGATLTDATHHLCERLDVHAQLLPMSDDSVATIVETEQGDLPFQQYFVAQQCKPVVKGLRYSGVDKAEIQKEFKNALEQQELTAIIICPSNPFLSIQPILELEGVKAALQDNPAPVIAVSPIVAGAAIKGPTAKMMQELGLASNAVAIANYYRDIVDGFVLDNSDSNLSDTIEELGITVKTCATVMKSLEDKIALAKSVLAFSHQLAEAKK